MSGKIFRSRVWIKLIILVVAKSFWQMISLASIIDRPVFMNRAVFPALSLLNPHSSLAVRPDRPRASCPRTA